MAGVLTETLQILSDDDIETSIKRATATLLASQKDEGHWIYELEADVTLTAQYVMLVHFLGEPPNILLEQKISCYLRRLQQPQGGWPLYTGGPPNINTSVQAYLALRLIGDPPSAEHMTRARSAILRAGGAEASNVFTRVLLALFGVIPWDVIPMIPVETILLPQWFPFHVSNISFWARTALVPLMILRAEQPVRPVVGIKELFHCKPEEVGPLPPSPHQSAAWFAFFQAVDKALRLIEPIKPAAWLKRHAIDKAVQFVDERVETDIGLGGAFIMTMNAVIMYDVLGRPRDDPKFTIARDYIEHLLVVREDEAYCQLCDSPVWDTVLAAYALLETGESDAKLAARRGLDWLRGKQITEVRGDWAWHRPELRPGGWAFQYENPYYPDVDDTAVVVVAMQRADRLHEERTSHQDEASTSYSECISRATEWVLGMQTSVGGWGAFEPENTKSFLENVPFTEFGALLDPPTSDVTGRCISMLAALTSHPHDVTEAQQRAIDFLLAEQEPDGSWYGRWGVNYIHGTWSALGALNAVGFPLDDERVRCAVGWLLRVQNEDGGWGEDGGSYALDHRSHEWAPSTPTQTAWALLGLMAAGEGDHSAVARGVRWLVGAQKENGAWEEEAITGTAFPRMFYLRYHGYPSYFPLWALARYRNLKRDGLKRVELAL